MKSKDHLKENLCTSLLPICTSELPGCCVTFRELKQTLFRPITLENTSKRQMMKFSCLTPRPVTEKRYF